MSSGGGGFNPTGGILGSAALGPAGAAFGIKGAAGGLSQGVGGFMGDLTGANRVAEAYGQAAQAQLGQQTADRQLAMSLMIPTDAEIQQLHQAMAVNQQSITQAQNLINSADPALVEAANQAMGLMQGKSAASLAPIQNQRAQQRSEMEQQLAQQLGSGYRTSSAGIQALNNFDQQTANLMTNAQQSTIGQYMGYAGMGAQLGASQQQQGFQNYLAGNQQSFGWRQNQVGALQGTPVNPGLQYSGDIARNQGQAMFGMGPVLSTVGSLANSVQAFGSGAKGVAAAGA